MYGFDFDLFECQRCGRPWMWAWRGFGDWNAVSDEDAREMKALPEGGIKSYMKQWARHGFA